MKMHPRYPSSIAARGLRQTLSGAIHATPRFALPSLGEIPGGSLLLGCVRSVTKGNLNMKKIITVLAFASLVVVSGCACGVEGNCGGKVRADVLNPLSK
jgi:hypothetical protein